MSTQDPFLNTYGERPLTLVRGSGRRVLDDQGRWYLDAICGIAVNALGHEHPRILAAIAEQSGKLLHTSNLYHVPVQRELAQALVALYDAGGVFLCNSGAEANESALKLARKYHYKRGAPRAEILVAEHAFHGRTLAMVTLTGRDKYQEGYHPLPPGVRVVPDDQMASEISEATCAVFLEPVRGEGGCLPFPDLQGVRDACDAHGALLVYDEIQCGLGRTGTLRVKPEPDIRALAKALGGGLPLGAMVAAPHLADVFGPGDHGSTFGGNPVACAAGLAFLQVLAEEGLEQRCTELGALLRERLEALGVPVVGQGLMLAAQVEASAPLIQHMREVSGVLVCPAGPNAVRFLPAFNSTEAEIHEMADALGAALLAARAATSGR